MLVGNVSAARHDVGSGAFDIALTVLPLHTRSREVVKPVLDQFLVSSVSGFILVGTKLSLVGAFVGVVVTSVTIVDPMGIIIGCLGLDGIPLLSGDSSSGHSHVFLIFLLLDLLHRLVDQLLVNGVELRLLLLGLLYGIIRVEKIIHVAGAVSRGV